MAKKGRSLKATQRSPGEAWIVMGDLNVKVASDNTLIEHVMGKYEFGDENDNNEGSF